GRRAGIRPARREAVLLGGSGLDGQVAAAAPLGPGAIVAAHVLEAHEAEDEVAVRAAPEGLAVGHDLEVGGEAGALEPGAEPLGWGDALDVRVAQLLLPPRLRRRRDVAAGARVEPAEVPGAGYPPAARAVGDLAGDRLARPGVDHGQAGLAEARGELVRGDQQALPRRRRERRGLPGNLARLDGSAGLLPGVPAAVQHAHVVRAQVL